MNALTTLARTWPMLSALGGGLVLLALAAGAGGTAGVALAGVGIAGLGWGVLSLRAGRGIAPAVALGVSAAVLVGGGALVGTGLAASTGVAVGPLVAASAFIGVVAVHSAFAVRRAARAAARPIPDQTRAANAAPPPAVDGRRSLAGMVAGALLVAGLATPALAATEAGELAVPHGEHGRTGTSVTDADHGGGGHH